MPGTVYTVASGKGGVGKTTTSVNLAVALWREGNAVALVDADIGMANLAAVLDLQPEETLHDVLAGRATVEEAVIEAKDGDLMVLPGDRSLDSFADADPATLRAVVSDLAGRADYVIVDTGAGLSYEDVLPLGMADGVVLVTTPDPAAFGDTMKTMEVAGLLDAPIRGLVVTRAVEDTNTEAIAAEIGAELLGAIPEDPAVMASTVAGDPLESHAPDAEAAAAYRDLATTLLEGDEEWLAEHAPEPAAGAGEPIEVAGDQDAVASPEEGENGAVEGRETPAEPDAADVEADQDAEADEASEGVADESGEEPAEPGEEPAEPGDADPRADEAIGDDDRDARGTPDEPGDDQETATEAEPGDDQTAGESAETADGTEPGPPTPSTETAEEAAADPDDGDEAEPVAAGGDEAEDDDDDALDEEADEAGVDDEDESDADVDDEARDATGEDAEASEEVDDEDDTSEEEADDEPEPAERRGGFLGWLGRLFS